MYDALNVLIAINVVSRDKNEEKKKTITWNGIGEEAWRGVLIRRPRGRHRKDKNEKQDDAKREKDVIMKKKKEEEEEEQQQQQMIMKKRRVDG